MKERFIMNGLKMNLSKKKDEILAATAVPPREGDFVWDGKDEDDRPLSKEEMRAGIKGPGGRHRLANPKKHRSLLVPSGRITQVLNGKRDLSAKKSHVSFPLFWRQYKVLNESPDKI